MERNGYPPFSILLPLNIYIITLLIHRLCVKESIEKYKFFTSLENITPINDQDRRLHYQTGQENLRFNKNIQWNIVYYCVLLFAAILGLKQVITINQKLSSVIHLIILLIAALVFDISIFLIILIQFQIRNERLGILRLKIIESLQNNDLESTRKLRKIYIASQGFLEIHTLHL